MDKIVVSFHTSADAFAFEKACDQASVAGRLTTIPRVISAGCGLAWTAPLAERARIEALIGEQALLYEGLHEMPH